MKRLLLLPLMLLACGTMAQIQPQATENVPTPVISPTVIHPAPNVTKTPQVLYILGDGCWYVRTGGGYSWPVVLDENGKEVILCGGSVVKLEGMQNGYVEVQFDGAIGWMCNRAFGFSEECK